MMTSPFIHSLAALFILLPAFLLALSFHEFSHALVATLLGDDTPKKMGRLTLNPFAHIDPMGLFFLLIFKIGWAKPVIFDNRNFKHPRIYSILTAFAGPCANFVMALACLYLLNYFPEDYLSEALTLSLVQILQATAYINIMLGVFNILPIPPLDGGHLITALLIKKYPEVVVWIYRYSLFILLGIFLLPSTRLLLMQLIRVVEGFLKSLVI